MKSLAFHFTLLILFTCKITKAINTNSAYISYYAQKSEIIIKDTLPTIRTTYEIVFNFNDEKSLALLHNYSVNYSYFETLEHIEVFTKNPQKNGKIKTIEIKDFKINNSSSQSIFFDDEKEININFLGLTVGSEAHVKYTVSTKEAHFTDPMVFKTYLPTLKKEFELIVPKEVNISFVEKNVPDGLYKFSKEEKKSGTTYSWISENLEEEKSYVNAPSRLHYTPHVIFKINDFSYKGITRTISKSPADLFNWYINHIKEVNSKPSEKLKILADSITKNCTTEKEKIKSIYQWVQSNIRYVAFENGLEGLVPREAELVCDRRYGDCKDMSSLQFGLFNSIGIPAHLTWIGTRRIPYTYSELPMKNTDNHMIASVKLDGKWVFLDATDPNGVFGIPADHIQGKQAMINIENKSFELVTVPVSDATTNVFIENDTLSLIENDLEVKSKTQWKGLLGSGLANQLLYLSEKEKQEFGKDLVKGVSNNASLKSFELQNITNEKTVNYNVNYTIKDYVKELGNEKYINLLLDRTLFNSSIQEPNRQVAYSFKYNSSHEIVYNLKIPANYKVEYLPETFNVSKNDYGASIEYVQIGNVIQCTQKLKVNFPTLLMQPASFEQWNTFIKQLNKAYKESIILKKIN